MSFLEKVGAIAVTAVALVGCGSPYGGPEPLSEFPSMSLDLKYDDADGLLVTLNYAFEPAGHCALLEDDASALLNGRPVPLFLGDIQVTPPMGDDGSFNCVPPSVSLKPIPADLSPPWTIQIGDPSEVVSATFAFQPITPAAIGPVTTPVLTSWTDTLTIQMQDDPGVTAPYVVQATLTSSNGFGSVETAYADTLSGDQITPTSLVFPEALNPQSRARPHHPPGHRRLFLRRRAARLPGAEVFAGPGLRDHPHLDDDQLHDRVRAGRRDQLIRARRTNDGFERVATFSGPLGAHLNRSHLASGQAPAEPKKLRWKGRGRTMEVPVPAKLAVKLAVRWARKRAGMTQADLARRAGLTQPAVARLEDPDYNPTLDMLERVAAALGTRLEVDLRAA